METLDRLLTTQQLADYLGVPVATLCTWRHEGVGPPGFRVGNMSDTDPATSNSGSPNASKPQPVSPGSRTSRLRRIVACIILDARRRDQLMAHIRRHPKSPDRWQVRYIDPTGKERARNFGRKLDAERFLHTVEVEKIRGEWTNPDGGRTSFAEWSRQVQAGRIHLADSTSARDDSVLRSMVLPTFGSMSVIPTNRLTSELG